MKLVLSIVIVPSLRMPPPSPPAELPLRMLLRTTGERAVIRVVDGAALAPGAAHGRVAGEGAVVHGQRPVGVVDAAAAGSRVAGEGAVLDSQRAVGVVDAAAVARTPAGDRQTADGRVGGYVKDAERVVAADRDDAGPGSLNIEGIIGNVQFAGGQREVVPGHAGGGKLDDVAAGVGVGVQDRLP